ncbi:hypothetical protein CEQ15_03670 [Chryseobacterium indologenes]|nr:hypothetical protein CEQ15_03670 [Chryseobacterium indologenes]
MKLKFLKVNYKNKCCAPLKPLTDPKSNILTGAWQLISGLKGQMPCKDLLVLASCYVHPLTAFIRDKYKKCISEKLPQR